MSSSLSTSLIMAIADKVGLSKSLTALSARHALVEFTHEIIAERDKAIFKEEEKRNPTDMVNSPPHYNAGSVECIEAIRSALTEEEFRGYCKGNALKYVWRELHKGQDESLQKAIWYLNKTQE